MIPQELAIERRTRRDEILEALVFGAETFLTSSEWSDSVDQFLALLGGATDSTRVYVFQLDPRIDDEHVRFGICAEWTAAGTTPELGNPAFQHLSLQEIGLERWEHTLPSGVAIVGNTATFPVTERAPLEAQHIRAIAVVPIFVSGAWWGFMGFDDSTRERDWAASEVLALNASAGLLGAAVGRHALEQRMAAAVIKAQLGADIGDAVTRGEAAIEVVMHTCCEMIVRHLGAQVVGVWIANPETGGFDLGGLAGPRADVCEDLISIHPEHQVFAAMADAKRVETWTGSHAGWPNATAAFTEAGLSGGLVHPLEMEGHIVGVGVMLMTGAISADALDAFHSITDELGLAIERMRARSRLRETKIRYERVAATTVEGIIVHDGAKVLDANRAFLELLGYALSEVIGKHPIEFVAPESRALAMKNLRAEYEHAYEICAITKAGSLVPVELKASEFNYDGNRVRVVTIVNIRERKEAELVAARLTDERQQRILVERTRERAQFLADASRLLAASFDTETTLQQLAHLAVPFLCDYCVVSIFDEGITTRPVVVHRDPAQQDLLREAVSLWPQRWGPGHPVTLMLEQGKPVLLPHLELEMIAGNAEHLAVLQRLGPRSLMVVPIGTGGDLIGAIVFSSVGAERTYTEDDLTLAQELAHRAALAIRSARSYNDAQAATRDRDDMLAIVAHDLRNPLNTIYMGSELAIEMAGPNAVDARQLDQIRRAAMQMNRLIEDLLEATRLKNGQLALELARMNIAAVIAEAHEMLAPLAQRQGIALERNVQDALPDMTGDRTRLLQVLSNLVGNALKFTPRAGIVRIEARSNGSDVVVEIIDTGPGIAAEQLPHIFGRFWQAKGTDRRGVGLGLSIAKGIVEAHNGTIWVKSEVGTGSTFSFTIPTNRASS